MLNLLKINNFEIDSMTEEELLCYNQNKELYELLKNIKFPIFRDFTVDILNEGSSEEKLVDAIGVTKWLVFLLDNEHLLSQSMNSYFIDLLIASSLLHNLTYEYNVSHWADMFKARDIINKVNKEKDYLNIEDNYVKSICIPIESQLGKDMPNDSLIPGPNSPGSQVALACAIYYKKYKNNK